MYVCVYTTFVIRKDRIVYINVTAVAFIFAYKAGHARSSEPTSTDDKIRVEVYEQSYYYTYTVTYNNNNNNDDNKTVDGPFSLCLLSVYIPTT